MGEYGQIVGQGSRAAGGRGGGSQDLGAQIADVISDLIDRIAALPPEVLVVGAAVILGGLLVFRRA